jgi:outer membrane protein assembly factor BamB
MKIALVFISLIFASVSFGQSEPDFKNLPVLEWKLKADKPFISSPVIDGETVYTGSLDGYLYAVDINNGKVLWKYRSNGEIRSTVFVYGSRLYFTSGDGSLYCINKNTGDENWIFKTGGDRQYDIDDYFQSSPVVYNNTIYFGCGDGGIYAVSEEGKLKWSYKTGDVVHTTPAIKDSRLYMGSFDGHVYALDTESGELLWKFKSLGHWSFPKGEMQFSPTITNNIVYIGGRDYNLYALDRKKGNCLWNREFPRGWVSAVTPSNKDDRMIYVGTSDPRRLLAMHGLSEETKWDTDVKHKSFGKCAVTDNMLYLGTGAGKLYGLDIETGEIKWEFATDGYEKHHEKYFKPNDEYVDGIEKILNTDELFMQFTYDIGAVFSTPAISHEKGLIAFSSGDGTIYCLKRNDSGSGFYMGAP